MSQFSQRTRPPLEQIDALIDGIRAALLPVALSHESDASQTQQAGSGYRCASFAELERGVKHLVDAATGGTVEEDNFASMSLS